MGEFEPRAAGAKGKKGKKSSSFREEFHFEGTMGLGVAIWKGADQGSVGASKVTDNQILGGPRLFILDGAQAKS